MTGVRSENSLLFSLDNLQALATGSSLAMGGSTGEAKSGFATGEGSGLIDIRALASASGVGDDGDGRQEELPGLGSQPGAFEALGSPMLMATTEGRDRRKNYLLPVGLAGGCLLMASAMVATAILMKPDPATEAIGIAGPIAVADAPRHANVAGSTRSGPIRVVQLAGQDRAVQPATDADKPPKRDAKVDVRRRRPERSQKASEVVTRTPRTTEPKRPPLASNRGTSELGIAELMDGALEPRRRPSRRQVLAAMNRVKRSVQDCAKGQGGIAHAQLTVKGATGRVSHVRVTGKSGPVGSCIARAVRAARFPKFANAELEVTFPFRLSDGKS